MNLCKIINNKLYIDNIQYYFDVIDNTFLIEYEGINVARVRPIGEKINNMLTLYT